MTDHEVSSSPLSITQEGLESGSRLASDGDILLLVRGSGLFNDIPINVVRGEVSFNQDVKAIRAKDDSLQEWIYYWLRGNKKFLTSMLETTGIGAGKLDLGELKKLRVHIPSSVDERESILLLARSIDAKINLLRQQNETLEAMGAAVLREWLLEDSMEMKVGDMYVANSFNLSKKDQVDYIDYLDTGAVTRNVFAPPVRLTLEEAPSRAKRKVRHLNTIYSTVRPRQNHYGLVMNPPKSLVVSTGFTVLQAKEGVSPFVIYYLLSNKDINGYLHSIAEGSTSAYPSLKPSDLLSLDCPYLSKKKTNTFDKLCMSLFDKVHANHLSIEKLQSTRDILLPKLMSGEVTIIP